jgi:hypothetical protein
MDGQTPAAGLSYNLRVGTTPNGPDVMSAMADMTTGYRRVVQLGNAQQPTSWTLTLPVAWSTYHWSVQAVDGAYAGSIFAAEEIVECTGAEPRIEGIVDVPNDQGRQVSLSWRPSWYDHLGSPTPIAEYAVYRKIDPNLGEMPDRARPEADEKDPGFYPPGDWHYVLTVPACGEEEYAVVVPTLADSTISGDAYFTTFFVRALTDSPGLHFDSEPDSGYSVDNLEPDAPETLIAETDRQRIVFARGPIEGETFEFLVKTAGIDGIVDIPNDQGRQVSLSWTRSEYDSLGSPTPITKYAVYRKIDEGLWGMPDCSRPNTNAKTPGFYPAGDWHFILTVPACAEDEYAVVAPTLADSTISGGMYFTTFFIRALTDTPGVHFDSAPDSGYSVDNSEPEPPQGLTAEQNGEVIVLNWEESSEEDFDYYAIYRGAESGFPLGDPIGYSTTPAYTDSDLPGPDEYWYKITTTDFSGNESAPSDEASATTTGVAESERAPIAFFLGPAIPNPFNPVTEIGYGIPAGAIPSRVAMSVYDATGREVTTLVDADQGPGEYRVIWDGRDHKGSEVASGVYFYRLVWQGKAETRRMVLLK